MIVSRPASYLDTPGMLRFLDARISLGSAMIRRADFLYDSGTTTSRMCCICRTHDFLPAASTDIFSVTLLLLLAWEGLPGHTSHRPNQPSWLFGDIRSSTSTRVAAEQSLERPSKETGLSAKARTQQRASESWGDDRDDSTVNHEGRGACCSLLVVTLSSQVSEKGTTDDPTTCVRWEAICALFGFLWDGQA
jgi:hypothetical protein